MGDKAVSWAWITATMTLSQRPCYLLQAVLTPSDASTGTTLYDGESTSGKVIAVLNEVVATSREFKPAKPVYCDKGLHIVIGTNVTGVFIQWQGA